MPVLAHCLLDLSQRLKGRVLQHRPPVSHISFRYHAGLCVQLCFRAGGGTDQVFPAALWVSVFFMAILALQRSFAKEREGGTLDALLVVSRERSVLFYAKFLASFTILLLLEVVVVPLLWILIEVTGPKVNLWLFLASVFLGSWGLAAVGTLLSGITGASWGEAFSHSGLPILIPLLIGAVPAKGHLVRWSRSGLVLSPPYF